MVATGRRAELAANLVDVRDRISRAADAVGRSPDDVTLVVVTKTWPADDVVTLAELGVTDVGENRDQEAAPKAAAVASVLASRPGAWSLRWHFVGQLQSNKVRSVVSYADVVESVDRPKLVRVLDRAVLESARSSGGPLPCLVQVGLDPVPGRGGAPPAEVSQLAAAVAGAEGLELAGLMAVAPLGADPDEAFARLATIAERVRRDHPGARVLSAGMTDDLEQAVRHGATHVRVGRAVLGRRPAVG